MTEKYSSDIHKGRVGPYEVVQLFVAQVSESCIRAREPQNYTHLVFHLRNHAGVSARSTRITQMRPEIKRRVSAAERMSYRRT
jgi:hypothetical protein